MVKKTKRTIFYLRIFLYSLLIFFVFLFLYLAIVPSGEISYSWRFGEKSKFIGKLSPKDRLKNGKIIGNPVYFSLYTPRSFDKARLEISYERVGDTAQYPIVEAGVLVDSKLWRYDLKTIENKILDDLSLRWKRLRKNDLLLLQKPNLSTSTKIYSSVDEFLNNPPSRNKIALYNYDFKKEFLLADYATSTQRTKIFQALRGAYQFYTYIKNEDLDFNFSFLDLNQNKDKDDFDLLLFYNNDLIDSRQIDDDGISTDNGEKNVLPALHFSVSGLPEGLYKLELRANDDIITKSIDSAQNKISFINSLRLFETGQENLKLYTNANVLNVKTINPKSKQKIKFADSVIDLSETYRQFSGKSRATSTLKEINLERDGVILGANGLFTFATSSFINPKFTKVDADFYDKISQIDYILAKYKSPKQEGGRKTAYLDFDISKAYRENNKYNFIISIPGLRVEDNKNGSFKIDKIKIILSGDKFWAIMKNKIRKIWKK